jgi:uncharacterized protein YecT (DUF1311 family)
MVATLLALATPAGAQWAPETSCDNVDSGYGIRECLTKELVKADAALNASYKRAQDYIAQVADTSTDAKKTWLADLVKAQRAWMAYRDANCLFELIGAEWHNGSGTTAAQQACVLAMTNQRTDELHKRYTSN